MSAETAFGDVSDRLPKKSHTRDEIRSFGDFIRWVMNKAKAFVEAVVEISGNVFKLIIDGVKTFVLELGKDIGQFFEGLFKRLAEAFDRAVNAAGALLSMFEALFHWDDIITTKKVLEAGFDGLMTSLTQSLRGDIPDELRRHFKAAREQLGSSFADAREQLGDKRFDQLADVDRRPNPFEDKRFDQFSQSHGVQVTYVSRLAMSAASSAALATDEPTAAELDRFGGLMTRLKRIFDNAKLDEAEKEIAKQLVELGKDPSRFLQIGLATLLTVVEAVLKATLSVAEELIVLLLELLGEALVTFRKLLESPLHIPIISGLYKQITGSELSLLDVACLVLAAPATIIYKLLRGGQAPFKTADIDNVRQTMARHGDLRRIIEGPTQEELASADPNVADSSTLQTVFGICGACLAWVAVPFNALDDMVAMAEADLPVVPAIMAGIWGLGMGLSWPFKIADKPFAKRSLGEHLTLGMWIAELCWFGFGAIVTSLLPTKGPKWLPFVGPVLCSIRGGIRTIASIVAIVAYGVEANAGGIVGSVQGLISGLADVNRIAIPGVKRGGKAAPFIAVWLFAVGGVSDQVGFGLKIASIFIPDEALALEGTA